ncbi:hypothetical protein N7474_009417 [Penicillium riverlandense]|uniref:uncharacterized protein n=1 Tax=Penicillium riverlandense TaxID=1903569 RepID=UPI0025477AF3|nr:uncharacterized protein N7474_009417 [Penicillium riverlandense]KAJ5808148.1 hypothetical protein N7474_009417 [Penicillium riverlandense]
MAPIRRYLRISKYSVLECRIYLDNPSDSRWLLDSRGPVLARVFAAIRPLVLPKLREENERLFARKKGKPVKDVIAEDEFEVAIFLRESRTRHSLLTRNKTFHEPSGQQKPSTDSAGSAGAGILLESDSEPDVDLHHIPQAIRDDDRSDEGQAQIEDTAGDDEKKLRFRTHYESFNICGWVLCLLVTRKEDKTRAPTGQPLMEDWISTQAQVSVDED